MLISTPFLKSGITEDNLDSIQLAFTGQYPITSHLEWHNGQHLIAPQEGGTYVDVRAIADGKVVYSAKPDAAPSNDKDHPQNYAAFGAGPEWTDKGLVIIEHTTEIGADGSTPVKITFYSVYAHLKELATGIAKDKKIYRKDILGKPGQIYGQPGHIHFEICLDDANIKLLLGQDPKDWPAAGAIPTKDGRTDVVFGSTYIYLPANTPFQTAVPTSHVRGTASQTLNTPQWVQINYAGNATITSYKLDGSKIGDRKDGDAEYDMYKEASTLHNGLSTGDKANSSPSGWYELLRFGRNLGRGSAATDKDPLPANAAHWRKINTPEGERWADLNSAGTFKFSDADFPAFLGWNCYSDDTKVADQRCDSPKLKRLLTSEIDNTETKLAALGDPVLMFAYARKDSIKEKLRKSICKFATEFDQGDFEARYGHIKEDAYFKTNATGESWKKLSDHIKSLTLTDLPETYTKAQWHLHPLAFIEVMRKCGWLSKSELKQMIPNRAIRHQKVTANGAIENRYHWEPVSVNENMLSAQQPHLNRMLRKFGITTASRMACFLGNAIQETAWLGTLEERGGANLWYGKWHGRGLLQLTFPSNYFNYWRWLGRTAPETLAAALDHAVATARTAGNNSALRDGNFPGLTAQMIDWRDDIQSNLKGHAAQSAGFYWAKLAMARYADKPHALERREVPIYQHAGQTEVYYRSSAFWQASAAVNLPAAVGSLYSNSLNGFADRCCAYAQVLIVASDMAFPKMDGSVSLWPESLTTRRG